jgi:uncharacterized membrane protein YphA (DoxX/SURF4 family)
LKINSKHIIPFVWVNACRLLLASVFLFSGFVKSVDPLGSVYKLQDYLTAFGMGGIVPTALLTLAAVALSSFEFLLGVALLFGVLRKAVVWITLAFMGVMTPLTFFLMLTNPIHDCGCFGDAVVLSNTETFIKNVILLGASASVCWRPRYMVRLVTDKSRWIVGLYSLCFILGLAAYCYHRLPVLDFRPYRVGATFAPDGLVITAPHEGVATRADSTFIDFYAFDPTTGDDLTAALLTDTNYVFLLVAPDLAVADDANIDLLNGLYDYAVEQGYAFYGLTPSDESVIEQWRDATGAEYPFCEADEITLKTMIRANPGIIVVKGGTIIDKWKGGSIPSAGELTAPMEQLEWGQPNVASAWRITAKTLIGYIGVLALIVLADGIWHFTDWQSRKKRKNQ